MADFPQLAETNINPMAGYYSAQTASLANQLASNTLDSNTQTAANVATSGRLANELATQKNPLEITSLRQQLGLDPSPTLDKLRDLYNGGNGQPSSGGAPAPPPAGSGGAPAPGAAAGSPPAVDDGGFAPALASRESSNNPGAVNAGGYSGMFQMGAARLSDPGVGVYTPAKGENVNANTWQGTFNIPGFPNVKTHADFLASPDAQRAALAAEVANTDQAIATTPGADQFNPNGLRAVAHIGGVGGMQHFVSSGGAYTAHDNNGTTLLNYYNHFSQGGPRALQATFGHPDGPLPAAGAAPPGAPAPVQVAGPGAPAGSPAPAAAGSAPGPAIGAPNDLLGLIPPDLASAPPRANQFMPAASAQPPGAPGGAASPPPAGAAPGLPPVTYAQPGDHVPGTMGQTFQAPAASASPAAGSPVPTPGGSPSSPPPGPPGASAPVPPAPPVAPAPAGTGMNSPQVQQAQDLIRRATQIEMTAAQTPNDPRAKATAAAMAADLRGRAAVIMQADSVTTDATTGVQTHTLTGKQDSAATPAMNYQPDPNNPGVLISPGNKPVVLPPGRASTLPDGSTWVTGPGGTFKEARGPNLEGASAAATAAAGGAAAAASAAKTKDSLIPLARTSVQAISNIDYGLHQLDEAAKGGIPTGYFAPALATAAAMAKSAGIKIPGVDPAAVSDIQTASKTLAVVSGAILQNILGPNSEITEGKIESFIHAQPGIVNDAQATNRILNWARSQFVYDHEMAMDGLKNVDPKSGQLAPGWQAGYITQHGSGPIFDSATGEMKQPDGQGPSREPPAPVAAQPSAAAPAGVPPLAQRVAGTAYPTPKGQMTWTGTGWVPPTAARAP